MKGEGIVQRVSGSSALVLVEGSPLLRPELQVFGAMIDEHTQPVCAPPSFVAADLSRTEFSALIEQVWFGVPACCR
jgi:hypothetical protein